MFSSPTRIMASIEPAFDCAQRRSAAIYSEVEARGTLPERDFLPRQVRSDGLPTSKGF
jgi:hypothetical protein